MQRRRPWRAAAASVALTVAALTVLPAPPAQATGLTAVAIEGQAVFYGGVGTCANGDLAGIGAGVHGNRVVALGPVGATFSYCDLEVFLGTAAGTLVVDGDACSFTWVKLGVTAVLNLDGGSAICTGSGVLALVPTTLPGQVPAVTLAAGPIAFVHRLLVADRARVGDP